MEIKKSKRQEECERRHKKVCTQVLKLRKEHPSLPVNRIFETVAANIGMSSQGVRYVILKNGLYNEVRI